VHTVMSLVPPGPAYQDVISVTRSGLHDIYYQNQQHNVQSNADMPNMLIIIIVKEFI